VLPGGPRGGPGGGDRLPVLTMPDQVLDDFSPTFMINVVAEFRRVVGVYC